MIQENQYFKDYVWKKGAPIGIHPIPTSEPFSYKIISDPYRKWISVEKYKKGRFDSVVYDSNLLDFRKLEPKDQVAWEKIPYDEQENEVTNLIKDENDRVILIEKYRFEGDLCKECLLYSPHFVLAAKQKIFYEREGDGFNGIILYDINDHVVVEKRYKKVDESGQFIDPII